MRSVEYVICGRNYLVFDDGEVIRLPTPYRKKEKKLSPTKTSSGYLRLCLVGGHKMVHRIIYEAFNGEIAKSMDIDHINGIKDDNRLCNLRAVTRTVNALNRLGSNKNSSTGVRGVYFHKSSGCWVFSVSGEILISSRLKSKVISFAENYHG
jgi:hypothetical protein